jgi:hypothetical protein
LVMHLTISHTRREAGPESHGSLVKLRKSGCPPHVNIVME